jgi:hypothetical protein
MAFLTYFWGLVPRSLRSSVRWLEAAELTASMVVGVASLVFPEWREPLGYTVLVLLGLFTLTFLVGLLFAGYANQ